MENPATYQELNVKATDQPPESGVSLNVSDIDILKDRIEQQKANKIKAEQLVSTLSRIKAREKATRRSTKPLERKNDDSASNHPTKRSGTNSSSTLKEKSNLLKKKLEEDRAKFESKKGQEDLGKVSQIVEHIRVQLEDQDKTIQQMHSNFLSSAKTTQLIKQATPSEPDIPLEVKQRIADLEMKILGLQENLREKDSVISARTQAITLLSEDMARKGKTTLDTLEETRSQMKTMQANFIALEDRMNEERSRLREELESKKLRLQQLEKNYRAAESARFELATRVAELQEKVVTLQAKNILLEEEATDSSNKAKELTEALENANKQTIKIKAQFKSKLKALEEERDMLRKEERTNEELKRLRERIADLENEKEAGNILKERISEMDEKLHRQENDLDSHVKALTSLEAEKLDLIETANKRNTALKAQEETITKLQAQISQISETKIAAEMKCLELEEQLDTFIKTQSEAALLNSELKDAKQMMSEYQATVSELTLKLQSRELELANSSLAVDVGAEETSGLKLIQDMSTDVTEWQHRYTVLEEKLNSTVAKYQELEENKKAMDLDNESLVKECSSLQGTIENLNHILNSKVKCSDEETALFKETLAKKEAEILHLHTSNKTLETEVSTLRYSLESTTSNLNLLSQELEELTCTRQKLEDLSATINIKDKELEQTANELEERSRKLSEYKKFHKLKSEDVLRISYELDTLTVSSQQRIGELESALNNAQQVEEDLRNTIKELMSKGPESVDTKLQEQSVKMKKLAANVKLKTKLVKDLESKIEELEKALNEREIVVPGLGNENTNISHSVVNFAQGNDDPSFVKDLEGKCKLLEGQIICLQEELKSKTSEVEHLKNTSTEHESLVQIKELENQNKKLNDISATKSDQLKKMECDISDLSELNRSLMSELEQMQDSYKQDALKNESVLDGFQNEMLQNRIDVVELGKQLQDVTSKYEQTWAKLQEKEVYIEDLELQLEKVRSRLLHIESTVEDRRKSLEEKAEFLGARLCQAEKNNKQLEKHEDELENKIAHLLSTEEVLERLLEKFQNENVELSKSLSESSDQIIRLSQELESKQIKVQCLTKEVICLKESLVNFEKTSEDYNKIKLQLKESQEAQNNKIKSLEGRLLETEQSMESEIQRLLDKVSLVEAERQEVLEKCNLLFVEKQGLEEELFNLHKIVSEATTEELQQLKINHNKLSSEMSKELEKRETYIIRIQELESELLKQTSTSPNSQEVLRLKELLNKEMQEKERLKYELLKESAKKQIDDVVSKAEETFFTMTTSSDTQSKHDVTSNFFLDTSSTNQLNFVSLEEFDKTQLKHTEESNNLKYQLSFLNSENENLKMRLRELERHNQNTPENISNLPESDDWAAISKDEDDGWGWGSKDAILEHEHLQKQKVRSDLKDKISELEKKLFSLQEENAGLTDELKSSQSKCSKLLKKVKEFKIKSDSLERSSREKSIGFDDLDLAMQDELKAQVEKLEKHLKECNSNLSALQLERENLLLRIDTLTSGNERLIEMKERQDIEVDMWQRKSNELQNKIQGLEWTLAELNAERNESNNLNANALSEDEKLHYLSNAFEMDEKLNALAAENDYLQSLIGELKDKVKKHECDVAGEVFNVKNKDIDLQSAQENERLNSIIHTLEGKLKIANENTLEHSNRIESLIKENEWLSCTVEQMKYSSQARVNQQEENLLTGKCKVLQLNNEQLNSTVAALNQELQIVKSQLESIHRDNKLTDLSGHTEEGVKVDSQALNIEEDVKMSSSPFSTEEAPTLFRGFGPVDSKSDIFETTGKVNDNVATSFIQSSAAKSANFFDLLRLKSEPSKMPEEEEIKQNVEVSQLEIGGALSKNPEKESELVSLRESTIKLKQENETLKNKLDGFPSSTAWDILPGTSCNESSGETPLQWNFEINTLNKKLEEQDVIIHGLKEKLSLNTSSFDSDKDSREEPNENVFLLPGDNRESKVNQFVEQITNLTKTLHDKEIEIELLTDKKKKYKEMYYALAKEFDVQSPDQSNSDKDLTNQNIMLNQLLDDKETELEIMSQQIEQTIVAKENLQDELSMKLCEMEAANNPYTLPKLVTENVLPHSEPENIEDVRTLCSEVEELTKLLQDKESEVELLKQQLDEGNIERENLLDKSKKEIQKYKEEYEIASSKTEEIEKELDKYCKDMQDKLHALEKSLKLCQSENHFLSEELNQYKDILNAIDILTQGFEYSLDLSLVEKIKKMKDNLIDIDLRFNEANAQIGDKDKTILSLKEKLKALETSSGYDAKGIREVPVSAVHVNTYASEPFRTSTEQSSSDDDSSSKHTDTMQNQVLLKEIQSLKQVLLMKDSEITRLSIKLNEAQENVIRGEMSRINSEEISLRHRLDEALYTLHLRDVRCEELSLELMQLLEERDSLQLRLSTAIRFNEELRKKSILPGEDEINLEREAIDSGTREGDNENNVELRQKLDQLHNVGYRRDPGMQHDQHKRHHEQMQLYTLQPVQEETQQTSGFFNWIFGSSSSGSQDV